MLKLAKDSLCPVCRIRPGLAIYYDKCEDCYIEPNAAHIRELYAEPMVRQKAQKDCSWRLLPVCLWRQK